MSQRRSGKAINGWAVVDKTIGISSTQAVSMVRRAFDARKAGHAGTLDPLASGLLPIALGEATKLIPFLQDRKKEYSFTINWGEERNTDDSVGEIMKTSSIRPSFEQIEKVLPDFVGQIDQTPPVFSAIKINGRRAYSLARAGAEIIMKPRQVQIFSLKLIQVVDKDKAKFSVCCGKGTYVRSLGRDIARRLDTFGYISALRRTVNGPFSEKNAIPLDNYDSVVHIAFPPSFLLPLEAVLDDIPAVFLNPEQVDHIRHGRAVSLVDLEEVDNPETLRVRLGNNTVCAMADGQLIALARLEGGRLYPKRVLNRNN